MTYGLFGRVSDPYIVMRESEMLSLIEIAKHHGRREQYWEDKKEIDNEREDKEKWRQASQVAGIQVRELDQQLIDLKKEKK